MLKLIIEDDEGRKTVVPFLRDEITIGRQEGNTIRLTERNVSRRHARLLRQNGHVQIEDLGSYNGIRVNGGRIAGRVPIADGDLIQIGDYDLAIQVEERAPSPPTVPLAPQQVPPLPIPRGDDSAATVRALPLMPEEPEARDGVDAPEISEAPPTPVRDPPTVEGRDLEGATALVRAGEVGPEATREVLEFDAAESPRLVVLNTELAKREFRCLRPEITIGRTDDNDFAVDHRSLSRNHCKLVRETNGEWRIMDLESANGVIVNGESYSQVTLRPFDVIALGHVQLQFLGPGDQPTKAPPAAAKRPERPSRAPLYAVIGASAVVVVGLGGYALWKNLANTITLRPDATGAPGPTEADQRAPIAVSEGSEAQREIDQKLVLAEVAIEALDWAAATEILSSCTVDGVIASQAQKILTRLDAEKGNRAALEEAARLLKVGDDLAAKKQLDAATHTTLLKGRLDELLGVYAAHIAAKLKRAPVAAAPTLDPMRGKTDEAEGLYHEAQELTRSKQLNAAGSKLERCMRIAPMYYHCYKLYGSVQAKISVRDTDKIAYEKARRSYERFIELAPATDPDVPRVKSILDNAD